MSKGGCSRPGQLAGRPSELPAPAPAPGRCPASSAFTSASPPTPGLPQPGTLILLQNVPFSLLQATLPLPPSAPGCPVGGGGVPSWANPHPKPPPPPRSWPCPRGCLQVERPSPCPSPHPVRSAPDSQWAGGTPLTCSLSQERHRPLDDPPWEAVVKLLGRAECGRLLCPLRGLRGHCAGPACVSTCGMRTPQSVCPRPPTIVPALLPSNSCWTQSKEDCSQTHGRIS